MNIEKEAESMCEKCIFFKKGICTKNGITSADRLERARIGICEDSQEINPKGEKLEVIRVRYRGVWYTMQNFPK